MTPHTLHYSRADMQLVCLRKIELRSFVGSSGSINKPERERETDKNVMGRLQSAVKSTNDDSIRDVIFRESYFDDRETVAKSTMILKWSLFVEGFNQALSCFAHLPWRVIHSISSYSRRKRCKSVAYCAKVYLE